MIWSSERKKILSGWFLTNEEEQGCSPLKLQKFLFFYELMSKVSNEYYDLTKLRGYDKGPVFSDVYGDYRYEKGTFFKESTMQYERNKSFINEEIARKSAFLTKIMTEKELSELTHKFNIWKAKSDRIASTEKNVDLEEDDFNRDDAELMSSLLNMYSIEYINSYEVITIADKTFVIHKDDLEKIRDRRDENGDYFNKINNTLETLADYDDLKNPVYINLDERGALLVD